jgi:preprotein translocase subunit SecD
MIAVRLTSVIVVAAVLCACQSPQHSASPTSSVLTTVPTSAPTATPSAGPVAKIKPRPVRPQLKSQPTTPDKCPATNPNAPVAATDVLTTCDLDRTTLYTLGPEGMELGLTRVDVPKPEPNGFSGYEIEVTMDALSAAAWASYTAANIGTRVGFIRDDLVISAGIIQESVSSGKTTLFAKTAQKADQVAQLAGRPA